MVGAEGGGVPSMLITELSGIDLVLGWALIWYFVYFLETQVLLSTKPGINNIITKSLVFGVSGFPNSGTL